MRELINRIVELNAKMFTLFANNIERICLNRSKLMGTNKDQEKIQLKTDKLTK